MFADQPDDFNQTVLHILARTERRGGEEKDRSDRDEYTGTEEADAKEGFTGGQAQAEFAQSGDGEEGSEIITHK